MQCPACQGQLVEVIVDDVTVDVCLNGCAGIWFDNYELKKCDEQHEQLGEALLNYHPKLDVQVDPTQRYNCPRCENMVLMRHYFSVKRQVEIDDCPGCGGVWLDAGELRNIRNLYKTEADRKAAAQQCFSEMFDQTLFAKVEAEDAKLQKARKFASALRFICPTYWLSGMDDDKKKS